MQAAETLVMALLALLVMLLVVRPLVRRIITPEEPRALAAPAPAQRRPKRRRAARGP